MIRPSPHAALAPTHRARHRGAASPTTCGVKRATECRDDAAHAARPLIAHARQGLVSHPLEAPTHADTTAPARQKIAQAQQLLASLARLGWQACAGLWQRCWQALCALLPQRHAVVTYTVDGSAERLQRLTDDVIQTQRTMGRATGASVCPQFELDCTRLKLEVRLPHGRGRRSRAGLGNGGDRRRWMGLQVMHAPKAIVDQLNALVDGDKIWLYQLSTLVNQAPFADMLYRGPQDLDRTAPSHPAITAIDAHHGSAARICLYRRTDDTVVVEWHYRARGALASISIDPSALSSVGWLEGTMHVVMRARINRPVDQATPQVTVEHYRYRVRAKVLDAARPLLK